MQSIQDVIILLVLGGLGGLLAGMLGVGGGIIYVLIFTHYLDKIGVPKEVIVPSILANSMFAIFFAGVSGTYKQWKNNNFFPKQIIAIAIPAAICSILFSYLISIGTWYTRERFTIFFILLLIYMAIKIFRTKDKTQIQDAEVHNQWKFSMIGTVSGTLAAFSGIGGGIIIVPFLTGMLNFPIKKATSVSLGVISLMAMLTSLFNIFFQETPPLSLPYHYGLIFFAVSIPVAVGSLIFSPIGVALSSKFKPNTIRILFVVFLIIVISKMIYGII